MEERLPSFKEIIEDESFIRWVKNNSWQDASYWEEKIRQNPEIMEDTAAAKKLIEHFSANDSPVEKDYLDGIWDKIDNATTEKGRIRPFRSIYLYAASAAAVLIFLVIGLLPQMETFTTENGEITNVTLPDDSEVTLNAGSQIVYSGNRFNTHRKVQLTGEAYFKVSKGNTFSVVTTEGTIKVLGTTFNVRSRDKKLSVICYTGKVKVSDHFTSVYLTKGEKTAKLPGEILQDAQPTDTNEGLKWRNGLFYFQNTSLKEVLAELSRQYDAVIYLPESEEKRVITTSFDNKNITSALFNILWPLNLKAENKDGKYIVQKSVIE
ncbi:MAG: FecR family protein [Saprospiraceae bacterium]|jgi:ferric-dicitrate binding protein FerR (iron transport regulator)